MMLSPNVLNFKHSWGSTTLWLSSLKYLGMPLGHYFQPPEPEPMTKWQEVETSKANVLKQCLGLSKLCHSADLLRALNVKIILLIYLHTM